MIPDPSSVHRGRCDCGTRLAVLYRQREALPERFWMRCAEEYHFDLATPFQDYPKEIHDILIHGTNGHEVKVYYKGQRGEGVYDVAFEGLIKNVERTIPGDRFRKFQSRNMRLLCGSRHVRPAKDSD